MPEEYALLIRFNVQQEAALNFGNMTNIEEQKMNMERSDDQKQRKLLTYENALRLLFANFELFKRRLYIGRTISLHISCERDDCEY